MFDDLQYSQKQTKRTFHIVSIKISLNVWSDFDKRWLDYLIILGKVAWLNRRQRLWRLRCKFCVYRDFIWFYQPKNLSLNYPPNTILQTFPYMVGLVIVSLKLYWLIKVCQCKHVFRAELRWASITPQNNFSQWFFHPLF